MQNYFDIFDLPVSFEINKTQLKQSFNTQIIAFHPDKFTTASDGEKLSAAQNTSLLNTAFSTLSSDLQRATYILELNHINAFDEKDTNMNGAFLMEMIELQEELEGLSDELAIDNFIDDIEIKIKKNIENIADSFVENNVKQVKNLVRELKFYSQTKSKAEYKIN